MRILPADLRIGSVPFLNARPLIEKLPPQQVTLAQPVDLARSLEEGKVDIALVPVMEVLRHSGYRILNGWCIGSMGPVESVLLQHSMPLEELKRVALDSTSLTSVNLCRVLLGNFIQLSPSFVPEGEVADGRVWIGDRARELREQVAADELTDLGELWTAKTGLPFVFAVWAIHPDREDFDDWKESFRMACAKGVEQRELLARNPADARYLTKAIRYPLREVQLGGIHRFGRELVRAGRLRTEPELRLV